MAANDIIIPGPLPVRVTNFNDAPQGFAYYVALKTPKKLYEWKMHSTYPVSVGEHVFFEDKGLHYRVAAVLHCHDGSMALILDAKDELKWPVPFVPEKQSGERSSTL